MKSLEVCLNIFTKRLKEYMHEKGIPSILALSKIVGLSERTLNGWMRNVRTPHLAGLLIISQKLNISLDYLVGLIED